MNSFRNRFSADAVEPMIPTFRRHRQLVARAPAPRYIGALMPPSRRGPLGLYLLNGARFPGPLGRNDAASPDATATMTGDTPGALGRADRADPDHPAFRFAHPHPRGPSIVTFADAESEQIFGRVRLPKPPRRQHHGKLPAGVPTGIIESPPWLKIASQEEAKHIHEGKGPDKNNERILQYIAMFPGLAKIEWMETVTEMRDGKKITRRIGSGRMMSEVDETPWCGCFVSWCLAQAGIKKRGYPKAIDWVKEKYGTTEQSDAPRVGSIAVVSHPVTRATAPTSRSGYHVGFYVGGPASEPVLLGGNQGDAVSRKQFVKWTVLGYRWPPWEGDTSK